MTQSGTGKYERLLERCRGLTDGAINIAPTPEKVILTSRADSLRSRVASTAVAVMAAHARRKPPR